MEDFSYINSQLELFENTWPCLCNKNYTCHLHSETKNSTYLNKNYSRTNVTQENVQEVKILQLEKIGKIVHNFGYLQDSLEFRIPVKVKVNFTCESQQLLSVPTDIIIEDSENQPSYILYDICPVDNFFGLIITFKNIITRQKTLEFNVYNFIDYNITIPKNYIIGYIVFRINNCYFKN